MKLDVKSKMLLTLLLIPTISFVILICLNSLFKNSFSHRYTSNLTKYITLLSLNFNLLFSSLMWKFSSKPNFHPSAITLGDVSLFEVSYNFGLPFLILSSFILIIAVLTSWNSSVNFFLFNSLILLIEFCLVGAFSCTSFFLFLLFFEASALPIFILISYCGSPRRERLKASYYFLFFTLYGSLSLLLLILNWYSLKQIDIFSVCTPANDSRVGWVLLFIAFAVKIPLFPFHIWLPYAHVEASTPTSIILAALMLKLGGYGLLKFMLPMFSINTHLFFRPVALFICITGAIYGGLGAIRQIDMKRQIAFSSISHMSFASAGIFTFTEIGIKGSLYLMLSHGLTSAALFYLVGVLSDRYHTRSVMAFSGLISSMPVFSFFFIAMSLANVGFPGTSGFLPELMILVSALSSLSSILLPLLAGMLLTTVGSLVLMLRILFGHLKGYYFSSSWLDVTKLEFYILSILLFWILLLGFYDILVAAA